MFASISVPAGDLEISFNISCSPACTPGDPIPCPGEAVFISDTLLEVWTWPDGSTKTMSGTLAWVSGNMYHFTGTVMVLGPGWGGASAGTAYYGGEIASGDDGPLEACASTNVAVSATITGGTTPTGTPVITGGWDSPGITNSGSATCPGTVLTVNLYDCNYTLVATQSAVADSSGVITFTGLPAGEYVVEIAGQSDELATLLNFDAEIAHSVFMVVNPVIALWDDSGTTRRLEACPKMLLPPLTEATGDWYADCAAADTDIDSKVSNCVGYIESLTNVFAFTATDGGTSLTLAETLTAVAATAPAMWGSVNAEAGETLAFTATVGAGTAGLSISIYDDTGTLIESSGATSSPWTSSPLPYTGRYTIMVVVSTSSTTSSLSCQVTTSGTLSVNEIQALYATSPLLTCPARLNCGDTCP